MQEDCKYGLKCLRPDCMYKHPEVTERKNIPCIHFRTGRCSKGDRCIYNHNLKSFQKLSNVPSSDKPSNSTSEFPSYVNLPNKRKESESIEINDVFTEDISQILENFDDENSLIKKKAKNSPFQDDSNKERAEKLFLETNLLAGDKKDEEKNKGIEELKIAENNKRLEEVRLEQIKIEEAKKELLKQEEIKNSEKKELERQEEAKKQNELKKQEDNKTVEIKRQEDIIKQGELKLTKSKQNEVEEIVSNKNSENLALTEKNENVFGFASLDTNQKILSEEIQNKIKQSPATDQTIENSDSFEKLKQAQNIEKNISQIIELEKSQSSEKDQKIPRKDSGIIELKPSPDLKKNLEINKIPEIKPAEIVIPGGSTQKKISLPNSKVLPEKQQIKLTEAVVNIPKKTTPVEKTTRILTLQEIIEKKKKKEDENKESVSDSLNPSTPIKSPVFDSYTEDSSKPAIKPFYKTEIKKSESLQSKPPVSSPIIPKKRLHEEDSLPIKKFIKTADSENLKDFQNSDEWESYKSTLLALDFTQENVSNQEIEELKEIALKISTPKGLTSMIFDLEQKLEKIPDPPLTLSSKTCRF